MADLFNSRDYRSYLRAEIQNRDERGLITKMAEAAQCQRSHLSRVLSDQLQLTPEQAFRLTKFLGLSHEESTYFMKLVEYERAGDSEYRTHLKQELSLLRRVQEDLSVRMKDSTIGDTEREMLYYSSWFWSAIHIIVSIPKYQNTDAIAQRLNLSPVFVDLCLKRLEEFSLVKRERSRWVISSGSLHLSRNSPLNSLQHSNWRARAVMASQQPDEDGVHYTVVQSLSLSDFEKIKELILKTIDQYARIAKPSKEEELVCFACDFFKV